MKILIVIASPRKNGNTYAVVEKITEILREKEAEVEYVFLSDSDLGFCKGCCACLTNGEDYCPNKDDRAVLEEKILSADGVIFASPVYAMNMTALMKNFMDRFAYTMHRPRFFNQYTMVVSVTGSIGLKETINSISQLKYCGFNIVSKLGLVAPNALLNPCAFNDKSIKLIEKETENFYKKVLNKEAIKPDFDTMMQFRMQRKYFAKSKENMPCDWEYFNSKGWFDPKKNYYVDNAKLSFAKHTFAKILSCLF